MSRDRKLPTAQESSDDVSAFLSKVASIPRSAKSGRGRIIFALDATASRQPTWDQASHIQAEMFKETERLGGLEVQLLFYRGYGECKASKWLTDTKTLLRHMTGVTCLAGRTQLHRVLDHAAKEARVRKVDALIFVGDAMEEDIDALGHKAGELGLLGLPCFMFHEGQDPISWNAFQQIARLSGGACCRFDPSAARQLRDLLAAVAVYAAGGRAALSDFSKDRGGPVALLTKQVK